MASTNRKKSGRRGGSYRTCAGCRQRNLRRVSLRLVRDSAGKCQPDLYGKLAGHGMHLCPDLACFIKAAEQQSAKRVFRQASEFGEPQVLADAFLSSAIKQIESIFSIALRSGWLSAGRTVVKQEINRGRAAFIVISQDASASLSKEIKGLADKNKVAWAEILTTKDLSKFHKGKPLAVLAIRHRGLARRLTDETSIATKLAESIEKNSNNPQLTAKSVRGKMRDQRAG